MQIVKVKYVQSSFTDLSPREYSYFSAEMLEINDIVIVPVRDTTGRAVVTAVDVPESEIAAFKDKVKIIPENSILNLCDTCTQCLPDCKKKEASFGTRDNVFECDGYQKLEKPIITTTPPIDQVTPELSDALIELAEKSSEQISTGNSAETPETKPATVVDDGVYIALKNQIENIVKYAQSREIKTTDDLTQAGNDLIIMRKLEKSFDALRRQWVDPLNAQVKAINDTFRELSIPLAAADNITEKQIIKYKSDIEAARKLAEDLNRQAEELSRKQAAANNGEFSIDITPVTAPAPVAKTVRTDVGNVSPRGTWKAEVTDFKALSDEFKLPDMATLNTLAKSRKGKNPPAGVRFYQDESLSTRSK